MSAETTRPIDPDEVTLPPDGRPMEVQPAWRRDFPIDSPQDQYLVRREFMKFLVLTSVAFTAGQFWIAATDWWKRRGLPPGAVRIASVSDIAVGDVIVFRYPTDADPCLLMRQSEQNLVAFSQKCTHLSCAVIPDLAHGLLRCPCHEGLFDARSGQPIAGPPRRPLPRIQLTVRGRDIFATGIETRTI